MFEGSGCDVIVDIATHPNPYTLTGCTSLCDDTDCSTNGFYRMTCANASGGNPDCQEQYVTVTIECSGGGSDTCE